MVAVVAGRIGVVAAHRIGVETARLSMEVAGDWLKLGRYVLAAQHCS